MGLNGRAEDGQLTLSGHSAQNPPGGHFECYGDVSPTMASTQFPASDPSYLLFLLTPAILLSFGVYTERRPAMEIWPPDPWALFSQKTGAVYACCILVVLGMYAYWNRIAPVAGTVSLVVLILVFAAFLLLAGTSKLTWMDPTNAVGILLIAIALLLDGFFIAGAATFGPVPVLDVGVWTGQQNRNLCDFWREDKWTLTRLSPRISDEEYEAFRSWANNFEYTNILKPYPATIQTSLWDRQVYWVSMKNRRPPLTIGTQPHTNPRCLVELVCGAILMVASLRVYREGKRRGVQFTKYDPISKSL